MESDDILDVLPPKEKPPREETVPTPVRLPKSLLAALDEIAEQTNYRRADIIRRFLTRSVRQWQRAKGKSPTKPHK